ncbi:MAG: ABC transporter ATP-binding protein [Tissierellia bacterium]|nr:ABC transporter ATP-binding protein [Tissierellia bacterium]
MIIKDASFYYDKENMIFSEINLELKEGEILSIMGSNGTGKTTLIKCISGILNLNKGSIQIDPKKRLSYVPQAKYLNLSYNILDFISFGRYSLNSFFSKPTEEDYQISYDMMKRLSIEKLSDRSVNEISGGELQMCYIAKALVSDPHLVILDEPETNLDFKNQRKIVELLKELSNDGRSIILNTHFLNYASKISDKCLLMGENEHIFGFKDEILNEENLNYYFHVPIKKRSAYIDGKNYDNFIFV